MREYRYGIPETLNDIKRGKEYWFRVEKWFKNKIGYINKPVVGRLITTTQKAILIKTETKKIWIPKKAVKFVQTVSGYQQAKEDFYNDLESSREYWYEKGYNDCVNGTTSNPGEYSQVYNEGWNTAYENGEGGF